MWHAYNLIAVGDIVRASTIRKVQNESATGSSTSNRVRTTLAIQVETIDFDTQASMLRLKGRNVMENQYVKVFICIFNFNVFNFNDLIFFQLGAYHTLDLEVNRKFVLTKNEWDSVALERIDSACDVAQNADLAAVVMQEGLAHLCLVTASMTIVKAKIEQVIPRKRQGNVQQHEKVI